jgi:Fe2+ or Zn2+ uptake regulation protein
MATHAAPRAFAQEGRRDTRQRRAVREHLADSDSFVSAQRLSDDLRAGGDKVGLATIYRTLQVMAEAGEVDAVRTGDGETLYRRCGTSHHRHLVCRNCGDHGCTVVVTTHDLDVARAADHVLLLAGRVLANGAPAQVLTRRQLDIAFGLVGQAGP